MRRGSRSRIAWCPGASVLVRGARLVSAHHGIARCLGAGVLALAVDVASPPAAHAEEDEHGWLDAIVDFLTRPEGAPVDVPLRKQAEPGELPPAAAPDAVRPEVPETGETSPPAPPAAPPERLEGATLADVDRAVEVLVADIILLREGSGTHDTPPEPAPLEDRALVHVYVKTLEVWTRVAQVQRRLGLPAGAVGRIPLETIDTPDLLVAVDQARAALATVAAHAGVEPGIVPAAAGPAAAPAPSALYRRLAHASALLDALAGGPLASDDVHRHAHAALDEVVAIAATLGVEVEREPAPVQAAKRPLDVAQQLLRALYKAVALQERLHMDASRVPAMSLERASPPGNHDMLNQLRAELARIGWHLRVDEAGPERPAPPEGEGADGAFAAAQAIVRALDRLAEAAPE